MELAARPATSSSSPRPTSTRSPKKSCGRRATASGHWFTPRRVKPRDSMSWAACCRTSGRTASSTSTPRLCASRTARATRRMKSSASSTTMQTRRLGGKYAPDQITVGLGDEAMASLIERTLDFADVPAHAFAGRSDQPDRPPLLCSAGLARFLQGHERFDDLASLLRHPDVELYLLHTPGTAAAGHATADWLTLLDRYITDHLQGVSTQSWLGDPSRAARLKAVHDAVRSAGPGRFRRAAPRCRSGSSADRQGGCGAHLWQPELEPRQPRRTPRSSRRCKSSGMRCASNRFSAPMTAPSRV